MFLFENTDTETGAVFKTEPEIAAEIIVEFLHMMLVGDLQHQPFGVLRL